MRNVNLLALYGKSTSDLNALSKVHHRLNVPILITGAYLVFLAGVSVHLYRNPSYSMDSIQYMGNALLVSGSNIAEVHSTVYEEVRRRIPEPARDQLMGNEPGAPTDQNESRRARAKDPAALAEFLPFFAIRPLYNLVLREVARTPLGLVRSTVFISVASFFLMGIVLFSWMRGYAGVLLAAALAGITMISPPLTMIGRENGSDALATLVAFASLYLIFERNALMVGLITLFASIYFRTDFVVLAGPVILACWLQGRIKLWHGAVLSFFAVGSALTINHFAGDYGFRMLYYRNFVGTPVRAGEMIVHFTSRDYLSAFRSGITLTLSSFFFPFLLAGIGVFWKSCSMRTIAAVTVSYSVLHFIILPNWQERWFGVFYLSMALATAVLVARKTNSGQESATGVASRELAA